MTGHLGIPHFNGSIADLLETDEAWLGVLRGKHLYTLALENGESYAVIADLSLADLRKLGEDLIALAASEAQP